MMESLADTAQRLVAPGKGILAADESTPTIGKRLGKHDIENTEENRRNYRELFLTAPGIGQFLSGCILYKETLCQSTAAGMPFTEVLSKAGILAGIKVDEGLEPLDGCEGESHTKGLETLAERCKAYVRQGAAFSKWRSALVVTSDKPSQRAIDVNASELASYAQISQACGLVPIVEPEILIDGHHSMDRSSEVACTVLANTIEKLKEQDVKLEACILKIQMIMPGSEATKASSEDIAARTIDVLSCTLPDSLAGVVFLSGGQSEEEATNNLNLIVRQAKGAGLDKWGLSFSFGRSLQASVLKIWSESGMSEEGKRAAGRMAVAIAEANAMATTGRYNGPHPSTTAGPLKEAFRGWI